MIEATSRKYHIGRWHVDCRKMTIANEQESVQLSAKVFELLKLFIVSPDHIVSKDEAIEKVWLNNEGVGKTGFPNAVWFLRKVFTDLGAETDEVFVTIQKVGYQLIISPEAIEESIASNSVPKKKIKPLYLSTAAALIIASGIYAFLPSKFYSTKAVTAPKQVEEKRITNFEGVEEQPAISPNGKLMAFQWRQERKHSQIYIKDLSDDEAELRLVTRSDAEEITPVWSPDGQSLAYIRVYNNGDCQVRRYHLISNKDTLLASGCSQDKFNHGLDWSSDGKYLAYPKVLKDRVAIFRYDFATKTSQQLTYPKLNQSDSLVVFVDNNEKVAIIRKDNMQSQLITLDVEIPLEADEKHSEQILVENDNTMIGLAWDETNRQIIITKPKQGQFVIEALNIDSNELVLLDSSPTPGSVAVNQATGELVFSRHSASEYIEEKSLKTGQTLRRVASSSRDLYGQYIKADDSVLFVSNRSGNWELWLRQKFVSKQLTQNIGLPFVPTTSPSGKQFAVVLKQPDTPQSQLFLGRLPGGELTKVDNIPMKVVHPYWSLSEDALYFSGITEQQQGIYRYNIKEKTTEQITHSGESFAVEGGDGNLYVSRKNESGIWQFNLHTKQFTKVVDKLSARDFGNFFWMDDAFYYIERSDANDQIKQLNMNGEDKVVISLPATSIRNYRGISPTRKQSILISLHGINDADIYAMLLD